MPKSRQSLICDELVHCLVSSLTEIDEADKDFLSLKHWATNNLINHRNLDVNSYTVKRQLEGIILKMKVHCHAKKANQLEKLTQTYLASPIFDQKDNVDLKWSLLSFLLCIGEHPAEDGLGNSFIQEINQEDHETSLSEQEEWNHELSKRFLNFPDNEETLTEWSDDEISEILNLSLHEKDPKVTLHCESHASLDSISKLEKNLYESGAISRINQRKNEIIMESQLALSWFENSIQRPYWLDPNPKEAVILSEYAVMRECLWTLSSPGNGFIFRIGEKGFKITPIATSTLPNATLQSVLCVFAEHAFKFLKIDQWLNGWRNAGGVKWNPNRYLSQCCNAIGTYSEGVWAWSLQYLKKLRDLEREVLDQKETRTLLWLMNALEYTFMTLTAIHDIHEKAFDVSLSWRDQSLRLLSYLVQSIECGREQVVFLALLKYALRRFLTAVHIVLWRPDSPVFEDFLTELGIKRRKSEAGNLIWQYEIETGDIWNLRGLDFVRSLRLPLLEICRLRGVLCDLKSFEVVDCKYLENLVLDAIANKYLKNNSRSKGCSSKSDSSEIISDQKGIELPINNEVVKDKGRRKQSCDGNEKLSNDISDKFGQNEPVLSDTSSLLNERNVENKNINGVSKISGCEQLEDLKSNQSLPNVQNNLNHERKSVQNFKLLGNSFFDSENALDGEENVYLKLAFKSLQAEDNTHKKVSHFAPATTVYRTIGLEHLIKGTLLPVVQKRYSEVEVSVLQSLQESHGLILQLKMFKDVCLLQSHAGMKDFCTYLFRMMDDGVVESEGAMTYALHLYISPFYPEWAQYFDVRLKEQGKSTTAMQLFELCDFLTLKIEDLWPLSLVINSYALEKYKLLFTFNLVFQRATYCLQELKFKDIGSFDACYSLDRQDEVGRTSFDDRSEQQSSLPLRQRVHQLQLLRHWLLYLVGILRNHFVNAALIPFSQSIDELIHIKNYTDFLNEHKKLLEDVCRRCLLNSKEPFLQTKLSQLFSTVQMVRNLWLGSPDDITASKIDELLERYRNCHRFLANYISALSQSHTGLGVDGLSECLKFNCPA